MCLFRHIAVKTLVWGAAERSTWEKKTFHKRKDEKMNGRKKLFYLFVAVVVFAATSMLVTTPAVAQCGGYGYGGYGGYSVSRVYAAPVYYSNWGSYYPSYGGYYPSYGYGAYYRGFGLGGYRAAYRSYYGGGPVYWGGYYGGGYGGGCY